MRKTLLTLALAGALMMAPGLTPAAHAGGYGWLSVGSGFRVGGLGLSLVFGRPFGYPGTYYRFPRPIVYRGVHCTSRCFIDHGVYYHDRACPVVNAYFRSYRVDPYQVYSQYAPRYDGYYGGGYDDGVAYDDSYDNGYYDQGYYDQGYYDQGYYSPGYYGPSYYGGGYYGGGVLYYNRGFSGNRHFGRFDHRGFDERDRHDGRGHFDGGHGHFDGGHGHDGGHHDGGHGHDGGHHDGGHGGHDGGHGGHDGGHGGHGHHGHH